MADALDVEVRINGDSRNLQESAEQAKRKVHEVGDEAHRAERKHRDLSKVGSRVFKAIGAAALSAVTGVVTFSTASIRAYTGVQSKVETFQKVASNAHWSKAQMDAATSSFGVISGGAARAGATIAASMGMSGNAFNTLSGAAGDLAVKMGGVSGAADKYSQTSQVLSKAVMTGNVAALRRFGVVLDSATEKQFKSMTQQQRAAAISKAVERNVGSLNDAISKTPEGQFKRLSNDVAGLKVSFGGLLTGATSPQKFVASLTKTVRDASGVIKQMVPSIAKGISQALPSLISAVTALVPQVIDAIAQTIVKNGGIVQKALTALFQVKSVPAKAFVAIATAITAVAGAFRAVTAAKKAYAVETRIATALQLGENAAMKANVFILVISLIAALVVALVHFFTKTKQGRKAWHDFTTGLSKLMKSLQQTMQRVWSAITGFFKKAASNVKRIWNSIPAFFKGVWNGISGAFRAVGSFFGGVFRAAWNAVRNVWNGVTGFFRGIWNGIMGVFRGVGNFFGNVFRGAVRGVQNAWRGIGGFFSRLWNGIVESVKSVPGRIIGVFRGVGRGIWNAIRGGLRGVLGAVPVVGGAIISALHLSTGGMVRGAGTSTSDSVPVLASNGEFVVSSAAAQSVSYQTLNYINQTGRLPGSDQPVTINVYSNGADAEDIANQLYLKLRRR